MMKYRITCPTNYHHILHVHTLGETNCLSRWRG